MENKKYRSLRYALFIFFILSGFNFMKAQFPSGYQGTPFKDSIYTGNKLNPWGAQNLPGRVELAYYDFGGEGIAYHDKTPVNEGALLNHKKGQRRLGITARTAFFRENEGVDITYTKDNLDFNHPNKVDPKVNQLYIGWQEEGEWANYTIYVHHKGKYIIYTSYSTVDFSSSDNKPAELWVDNKFACRLNFPEITGGLNNWTQSEVGSITFPDAGRCLLTLKFGTGVNYGYLDFLYNEARQK
jgi:hypothetical protein